MSGLDISGSFLDESELLSVFAVCPATFAAVGSFDAPVIIDGIAPINPAIAWFCPGADGDDAVAVEGVSVGSPPAAGAAVAAAAGAGVAGEGSPFGVPLVTT